jgi:hypothetical protein
VSSADVLTGVALAVAVAALLLAVVLGLRLRVLRRGYDALVSGAGQPSFSDAFRRAEAERAAVRTEVDALRAELATTRSDLATALRHVAVVRYDAFNDMGGRMSFSAALLDDSGDGVVITAINGRSEARTYAKGVVASASEHALSPEELEAVGHASRALRPRARTRSSARGT